jgi:hypothetical protein
MSEIITTPRDRERVLERFGSPIEIDLSDSVVGERKLPSFPSRVQEIEVGPLDDDEFRAVGLDNSDRKSGVSRCLRCLVPSDESPVSICDDRTTGSVPLD